MTKHAPSIILVTMGGPEPLLLRHFRQRVRAIDLYDLSDADFTGTRGLLLGMHCDQRWLQRMQTRLTTFVEQGGRVAVCGQIAHPFLPGLRRFIPLTNYQRDDLIVYERSPHPVWIGVQLDDLTYRRGVAGFYGRGFHTPPAGALVVNGLGIARLPLDFVYRLGRGEVLVHGGNDLWGYVADSTSAHRLTPQLLDWMERI
ncbi:MAG: hypothetical protein MI924_30885 [Chloroflexales bacterium]|nr:hypothetical protein [Chloroflexales bacterium]